MVDLTLDTLGNQAECKTITTRCCMLVILVDKNQPAEGIFESKN